MKNVIIIMVLFAIPFVHAIQISQVYVNPINSESDGELIELYNPHNYSVDITGYIIETTSSLVDATLPNGVMFPGTYYLIADEGYSNNKEEVSWPDPNYEEDITLANNDGGIILRDRYSHIIDVIGWGNPPNSSFGEPLSNPEEGEAFIRIGDTNNNSVDFILGTPYFHNSQTSGDIISLHITILETDPSFIEFSIEDDFSEDGIQLMPYPKITRRVYINVSVENSYNTKSFIRLDILNQTIVQNGTHINGTDFYSIPFDVDFTTEPDQYLGTLILQNDEVFDYINFNVTITPTMGFEVDTNSLNCNIEPENICIIYGDYLLSTLSLPTVHNIGNVPINFSIRSISAANGFPINNIYASFDNFITNQSLEFEPEFPVELLSDATIPVGFMINAHNVSAGNYTNLIELQAR